MVAAEVAVPGADVRVARLLMGAGNLKYIFVSIIRISISLADQTRQTSVVRAHPNAVSAHGKFFNFGRNINNYSNKAPNPRLSQSRARDPEAALRSN